MRHGRFQVYQDYIHPTRDRTIAWNQRHPLLRDARVRRALTLAINPRELHGVLNRPLGLPILDVIFTERQLWRGELPAPLP